LHHASFTPFVISVVGVLGHKALMFLQWVAKKLFGSCGKNYGQESIDGL